MFVLNYVCALVCFVQNGNISPELHPSETLRGVLNPGATQSYQLKLNSGTIAELVLHQGGSDLVATITSPNGDHRVVDQRENGPEPILIDAPQDGIYSVKVGAKGKGSGPGTISYTLAVGEFRPKQEYDDLRLEAQRLSTDAKQITDSQATSLRAAVDLCSKALALERQLEDRKAEAAVLVQSGAYLLQLNELEVAKTYLTQALALARSESEQWTEGTALNNLGLLQWESGEFSEAIENLNRAMAIWQELGYSYGRAAALSNLGLWYRSTGSYQKASNNYRQALTILVGLGDHAHEAYLRNNLGVVQLALAENSEALVSFRRAAHLYHAAGNSRGEARAMIHIARTYAAGHQMTLARRFLKQALPLSQKAGDYLSVADGLKLSAELLTATGHKASALQECEKALALYRKISNPAGQASVLHSIGVLHGRMSQLEAALDYLNQALAIRQTLGIRDEEAETLFQLAQVEQQQGELSRARSHIDSALDLIESVRALVTGPQFRMTYLASKKQYYSFACELYRQLDREDPATGFMQRGFELAERGRARSLLDLLAETNAGVGKGFRAELASREGRLHEEINVLSENIGQLSAASNTQKREAAIEKLDAKLAQYYELESEIRDTYPRYARLAPTPVGMAEVQKNLLDEKTVLLEYAMGDRHSSLWVLTQDSAAWFDLPGRDSIEHAARRFFESLEESSPAEKPPLPTSIRNAGQELSRMVLPPASLLLARKRIVIVGDGVLQRVPFAALRDRQSNVPLIEKHEIVFLPSAAVLAAERNRMNAGTPAPGTIAVMADPVFDAGDARNAYPASGITPVFNRLPYSRHEAETILSLVPPERSLRALDFAASRSLLISGRLSRYEIVHIATHAVVDVVRPELSELVFSLMDSHGTLVDGRLRLHEIAALRLSAHLVTLSACGTALGQDVGGEGTVGFAREFIRSGATAVVVSLWDVEDESTAELMKLFYQGILGPRHLRPAAALQEAQRTMSDSKRWTPAQWSGWLVVGDWR